MVVTASTLAIDSRPITPSTRSRSLRTRSRTSLALSTYPSLLIPMRSFSLATQRRLLARGSELALNNELLEVLRRGVCQILKRISAEFRKPPGRMDYETGLIPLPSIGHGREVRRIRLHQKPVEGRTPGGFV